MFDLFHYLKEQTTQSLFFKVCLQGRPLKGKYESNYFFKGIWLIFLFLSQEDLLTTVCPERAGWSAVYFWLNKGFTNQYKPGPKIIYSESTHWSDTSISSPAGDRENRGRHYKDHITEEIRSIFYPTLTLQTRPFSPGALPFPSQDQSRRKLVFPP